MSSINLQNLGVTLQKKPIVKGVSATFSTVGVYGILGPNGAGKSTLVKAVCGLIPHDTGEILYADVPLQKLNRKALARTVAYVPQNAVCNFALSVREIVLMGRYPYLGLTDSPGKEDHAIVEDALQRTGLLPLAQRRVTTLSGGEWQCVLIARALAQQTAYLIMDEPTAALDIAHQLVILSLLKRMAAQQKGVIVVLHDINLAAAYCDQILLLKNGERVAFGTPQEVLTSGQLSETYDCAIRVTQDPQTGRTLFYGTES